MTITNEEKERLNMSMPVANAVKLGDIIAKIQEGGGKGEKGDMGAQGPKGDKGDTGAAGFGTQEQYNDIIARLNALEGGV